MSYETTTKFIYSAVQDCVVTMESYEVKLLCRNHETCIFICQGLRLELCVLWKLMVLYLLFGKIFYRVISYLCTEFESITKLQDSKQLFSFSSYFHSSFVLTSRDWTNGPRRYKSPWFQGVPFVRLLSFLCNSKSNFFPIYYSKWAPRDRRIILFY